MILKYSNEYYNNNVIVTLKYNRLCMYIGCSVQFEIQTGKVRL